MTNALERSPIAGLLIAGAPAGRAEWPTPIHHAIGHLTVAIFELQQGNRRMDNGPPLPAQLTQTLGTIERHLRMLGMLLISLQEQPSRQP